MCLSSKISEHRETIENVETQITVHDMHEKPTDLESQHYSEQSIQREKIHPCHLNLPSRVDEVVQHFKTSSMNKCRNSQGESDANVKDSADKAIDDSSEKSERGIK